MVTVVFLLVIVANNRKEEKHVLYEGIVLHDASGFSVYFTATLF